MINVQKTLAAISPFPLIMSTGAVSDGILYTRSPMCNSCRLKLCVSKLGNESSPTVICENGNTIFPFYVLGVPFVVFGVITDLSKHKLAPGLQSKFSKRILESKAVLKWKGSLITVLEDIDKAAQDISVENLEAFHDVLPSISLVQRDVERLIQQGNGKTFENKLDTAPTEIKKLYKSVEILKERVNLMPLLTNPTWPTRGGKGRKSIYKMIDTLARSFRGIAHEKRIRINLTGDAKSTPNVYKSFSAIPFVLIDNAIKYSLDDQPIDITVNDSKAGGVEVSIQSYGPIVPDDMKDKIFLKKVRYSPSGWDPEKGSGLGLYLASLVSKAHEFNIQYKAETRTVHDQVLCGVNTFFFQVPP